MTISNKMAWLLAAALCGTSFSAAAATPTVEEVGGGAWRVRLAGGDGTMRKRGAVQSLAASLGEAVPSCGAPDGSRAEVSEQPFAIRFYSRSGRLVRTITHLSAGPDGFTAKGTLADGEGVYGFGERLDHLNQRGRKILLCSYDGWNRSDTTYAPIPFFATTSGAGVFVNDYCTMTADMGATKPGEWAIKGDGRDIDLYVWATDRMADAVKGVHRLQGGSLTPPEWSTGPIVCRYYPDLIVLDGYTHRKFGNGRFGGRPMLGTGVAEMLRRYEEIGARPKAFILEGWDVSDAGGGDRFRQRRAELGRCGRFLRSKGVKMMVYMRVGAPLASRQPGFRDDFLVHADIESDGQTTERRTVQIPDVYFNGVNPNPDSGKMHGRHVALDVTNPDMWHWYVETVWKELVDLGVSGVKIDFCEELPDDGRAYGRTRVKYHWHDPTVFDGAAVHHAYPAFFVSRFTREMARLAADKGGFTVLVRGGGIGSGRNPYMWAGDQTRSWRKLGDQIRAVLNSGVSGMPFMSYDFGGYQYEGETVAVPAGARNTKTGEFDLSRSAASEEEETVYVPRGKNMSAEEEERIFARALSFTAFMPCMQSHGHVRNAYDFGDATRRGYAHAQQMRERLAPYLAKLVKRAAEDGEPVVRPLVLDWQDDPEVFSIDDEFMLGDALLVAPLLEPTTSRRVYLPKGRWREASSGETIDAQGKGVWLVAEANGVMPPLYINTEAPSPSDGIPFAP